MTASSWFPTSMAKILLLSAALTGIVAGSPSTSILDVGTGNLSLQSILGSLTTSKGVVTIVSSPGTPSKLLDNDDDEENILSLSSMSSDVITLVCRGATLQGTAETERYSLAACSLVSDVIVLDGITAGDLEALLRHSRHARTLTALFRARIMSQSDDETAKKQSLILNVIPDESDDDVADLLEREVLALYHAAAVEKKGAPDFEDVYDLQVVTDSSKVLALASEAASNRASSDSSSLSSALTNAWNKIREAGVASVGLDPPHIANAFVTVSHVHAKQTKSARAKIASWKNRIARGLWVDGFGPDAIALRQRILNNYDSETLVAAGLPLVASYRLEMRNQLQQLLDTAITECYVKQVENLEKSTLKRFEAQMLKNLNTDKNTYESNEASMNANAAALRQQSFAFQNVLTDLEVPAIGLTKDKASRSLQAKLNDSLSQFSDSPAAKLKRSKQVTKVVKKEKKPGQRGITFGLDLVAMLRPDGFGSLQGFAGYSLPNGSSLTFGVHNDADDPQVIAQFGGVRPPLLRVQPKLRLDVEL